MQTQVGFEHEHDDAWQTFSVRGQRHLYGGRTLTTLVAGKRLSNAILISLDSPSRRIDGPIKRRFEVAPLADVSLPRSDGRFYRTSRVPVPGAPQMGGADDAPTSFRDLGWRPGVTGPRTPQQGNKLGALDIKWLPLPITRAVISFFSYPTCVPLGVYQVGPIVIATLPGEFTTVAGRRVRAAVQSAFISDTPPILLIGLANEYVSYFTTPEEYEAQLYEGASTLYGPASLAVIQRKLAELSKAIITRSAPPPPKHVKYNMGLIVLFGLGNISPNFSEQQGLAEELQDENGVAVTHAPQFQWTDVIPPKRFAPEDQLNPQVTIESRHSDGSWAPMEINGSSDLKRG